MHNKSARPISKPHSKFHYRVLTSEIRLGDNDRGIPALVDCLNIYDRDVKDGAGKESGG